MEHIKTTEYQEMIQVYLYPSGRAGNAMFRWFAFMELDRRFGCVITNQPLQPENSWRITDETFLEFLANPPEDFPTRIILDGFFQHDYWSSELAHHIQSCQSFPILHLDTGSTTPLSDWMIDQSDAHPEVVVHIRLDDFRGRAEDWIDAERMIHFLEMFIGIHSKATLICEQPKTMLDWDYLTTCIQKTGFSWSPQSAMVDFESMRHAKVLVCSMSTLSWAAAMVADKKQQTWMPFQTRPYQQFKPGNVVGYY
jgi:hypothetical protein